MDKKIILNLEDNAFASLYGSKVRVLYDVGNGPQEFFNKCDMDTQAFALLVTYQSRLNCPHDLPLDSRTIALYSHPDMFGDYENAREHLEKNKVVFSDRDLDRIAYSSCEPTETFELINRLKFAANNPNIACPLYFTNGEKVVLLNGEQLSQLKGEVTDKKDKEALTGVFDMVTTTLGKNLADMKEELNSNKSM